MFIISCDIHTEISNYNKNFQHCKEIVTMSAILEQPGTSVLDVPDDPIRSAGTARSITRNDRINRNVPHKGTHPRISRNNRIDSAIGTHPYFYFHIDQTEMEPGKVQTVTGPVDPGSLGITFCHEHLSLDSKPLSVNITDERFLIYTDQQVSLDNLWFVNQNPYGCLPNLRLCDENEAVIEEIKFFKKHGGGTIVENTTTGIKRDVEFYQRVAKEAGVNVIAGTGYYVEKSRPDTLKMTEEEMVENMKTDIVHGADGTNIRCGIVGEIGCSWPLTASEKTCVKAAATVQSELRCPVMVHPGRNEAAPFEIIRIYQEAGGDVNKLIMGHLDRTIFNREKLVDFASIGSYCEYDLFGIELSYYQIQDTIDMPSDAQRIQLIKYLIDEGFEDQITIAHDIHTKHRLMKYGGHGYSHILLNVLPKMRKRGITQEHINKMLKENPRKWLTFGK